jgi:hypothetical protein
MSLETFPYGDHDLQTVTIAKPYPARAPLHAENTDNESGYWVMYFLNHSTKSLS